MAQQHCLSKAKVKHNLICSADSDECTKSRVIHCLWKQTVLLVMATLDLKVKISLVCGSKENVQPK